MTEENYDVLDAPLDYKSKSSAPEQTLIGVS
jgi:hypothetical protein